MTGATTPSRLSLRERKKIRLRDTAVEAAAKLFDLQGYAETTLENVCEEAEVSLRTLLRYFPTKEDLALARDIDTFNRFASELLALDRNASVLEFWRDFESRLAAKRDARFARVRARLLDKNPSLQARMLLLLCQYEDLLVERLAFEAGVDPESDMHSQLLAGMLMAGNWRAYRRWVDSKGKLDLNQLVNEVVDWAIEHFPRRDGNPQKPGSQRRQKA